jgi:hypothetical protein
VDRVRPARARVQVGCKSDSEVQGRSQQELELQQELEFAWYRHTSGSM